MKKLCIAFFLICVTGTANAACTAATCARVLNPFTGKLDFVGGSGGGGLFGVVLQDTSGGLWSVGVSSPGNLVTTSVTSVPDGFIRVNFFTLLDTASAYWTVTVGTTGTLTTTAGGAHYYQDEWLFVTDTSKGWVVGVSSVGALTTL